MTHFITSSKGKFSEAKSIIPELEQLRIELPEIQSLDPHEVIKAKISEAFKYHKGPLLIDDTSLYFEAMNSLPGTFIKPFINSLGLQLLSELPLKLGNTKARILIIIAYSENGQDIQFFEQDANGTIVQPRGYLGFGFDSIFQQEGQTKTYAEMTEEESYAIKPRPKAFEKFKKYLESRK